MKTDIAEIMAMLDVAEDFRPVIIKGIEILNSYGPEFKKLAMNITLSVADMKMATIKKYEDNGFTRQEAMDLCMDEWYAIVKAARNIKSNKST